MLGVSPLLIKVIRKFDNKEKIKLEDILLLNEKKMALNIMKDTPRIISNAM